MRLICAVILILSSCGCVLGPNYSRPPIETPQQWRFSSEEARDTANTLWWEQFNDPVLNELIKSALEENKDLKIAAAAVREFQGRLIQARAPLFPEVNAGAGAGRERLSGKTQTGLPSSARNPSGFFQGSLFASWEIDLWGKARRTTEAAAADLAATEEGRRGVILSLVAAIADAYVNLRSLDSQLEIAQSTAKSRGETLQVFEQRFKQGFISELELSQARSEYEQAMATIPLLEKAIAQQEDNLSVLSGRNPQAVPRGSPLDSLVLPAVPYGLPSNILEQRPDVRQAEQALVAANARTGAARALYFPDISLTGALGAASARLSDLFTGPARTWNWGGEVSGPIFTAGAISGAVRQTEAVREEALYQYQKAVQNAFRDVEDSLVDQKLTRERLQAQKEQVAALRKYAGEARLRYNNGYTNYIDVLDAERSLFNAELDYTQTQEQLFHALVGLYKALGGGWVLTLDQQEAKSD